MGNIPGLPDFPADEVGRIAGDVMGVFSPMFVKAYPAMLVRNKKDKMDEEEGGGPSHQLRQPPTPTEPLLEGSFNKRGDVRLSWKSRYFKAMNAADNFKVLYFATEADKNDPKKAKGVMYLDGYRIQRVDDPEEQSQLGCGEFGIKMTCGRRRTWVVSFENEEMRKDWEAIFQNASRHAKPPMNEDPVLRRTFIVAYHRLRWHFSYWSWWTPAGTESEMLAMLIVDECNRECMGPLYHEVSQMSPTLRRKAESKVEELLDKTIGSIVNASWKSAMTSIEGMKAPVESKVEEGVGEILSVQLQFKNKVKDAIMNTLQPILEKTANPVLEPVMTHLLGPIYDAFTVNMDIFQRQMRELGAKDTSEHESEIKRYLRYADYYWGFMHESYEKLHKLTRTDGMQILSELCSGIYRWTIEDRIEDDLKKLQKRALYTFLDDLQKEEGEVKPETFAAVLAATMEKMAHDSKIVVQDAFVAILMDGLSPPFKREVVPAVQEIVSPISDAIPGPFKDPPLLNIDDLVEDVLMETLEDSCVSVAKPSCDSRNSAFDDVASGSG